MTKKITYYGTAEVNSVLAVTSDISDFAKWADGETKLFVEVRYNYSTNEISVELQITDVALSEYESTINDLESFLDSLSVGWPSAYDVVS